WRAERRLSAHAGGNLQGALRVGGVVLPRKAQQEPSRVGAVRIPELPLRIRCIDLLLEAPLDTLLAKVRGLPEIEGRARSAIGLGRWPRGPRDADAARVPAVGPEADVVLGLHVPLYVAFIRARRSRRQRQEHGRRASPQ